MNLQKGQSDGGGSASSSMIKSAKSTKGKKKEVRTIRVAYLSSWGVFLFYTPVSP